MIIRLIRIRYVGVIQHKSVMMLCHNDHILRAGIGKGIRPGINIDLLGTLLKRFGKVRVRRIAIMFTMVTGLYTRF